MNNFLNPALQYHAAGLLVVPFWKKESGGIRFPSWEKYRAGQTESDIRALFAQPCDGIGLLCVGGIEVIDIDTKHDPTGNIEKEYFEWVKMWTGGEEALKKCLLQKTKSGGWHLIYKTDIHQGNTKLAKKAGSKEAVIETRGAGGLVFVAPTPGYEIKRGSFADLQYLTDKERDLLIRCAIECGDREPEVQVEQTPAMMPQTAGAPVWEDYTAKMDLLSLLTSHGWQVKQKAGKVIRLTRPGSKSGDIHASIIQGKSGVDLFYPFTTATAYSNEKCYDAFGVYAVEVHRGDRKAAAKDLYAQGYGARITRSEAPTATAAQVQEIIKKLPTLIEKTEATKFDLHKRFMEAPATLHLLSESRTHKVSGPGQIGVFTGHEKSGKSYVLSCIAAAFLASDNECLNFTVDMPGKRFLWFDTEQSETFYDASQRRIHNIAGLHSNSDRYAAYHLRPFTPNERLEIIEHYVNNTPDLGCVVIDGYVDLINDYNDLKEAQAVVGRLMRWTYEKKILMMGVLHVNKGDGKIRGHIGSEIKNKCDFIVNVQKNEAKEYNVTNPACRYSEFPAFQFTRNDADFPIYERINKPGMFPAAAMQTVTVNRPQDDGEIPF